MKHTPGPWTFEIKRLADKHGNGYTVENYFEILGGSGNFGVGEKEHDGFWITAYLKESDARLISCAPEMLEVLESIQRNVDLSHVPELARLSLESIIKKAKGL